MSDSGGIEDQAARWLVRRDAGPLGAEEQAAFDAWLLHSRAHRAAYLDLARTWQRSDGLLGSEDAARAQTPDTVPQSTGYRARKWLPTALAASLACVAIAGLVLVAARLLNPWDTYRTQVGGFQRVVLTDGSIVELNTNTELRARFTSGHRILQLVRGEASFAVAHDSARPFDVSAGGSVVRAVGTAFAIRLRGVEAMELTVTEGRVVVGDPRTLGTATPAQPGDVSVVTAGEIGVAGPRGQQVWRAAKSELSRRLGWQQGIVIFDGQSLEEAVVEINRYNVRQLRIEDPSIAALRVGGRFRAADLDTFVRALGPSFGIHAVASDRGDELLLSR